MSYGVHKVTPIHGTMSKVTPTIHGTMSYGVHKVTPIHGTMWTNLYVTDKISNVQTTGLLHNYIILAITVKTMIEFQCQMIEGVINGVYKVIPIHGTM